MRFKSLLFLLLFFTGALFGQNCEIFDLQADIFTTGPSSNCTYFVKLDFKHTGGTNQFTVMGNGNNYGTFPYSQNPVTLGPFNSPASATNLEFVVKDAVLANCFDEVVISVPGCTAGPCEIKDLMAIADSCSSDSTYFVKIDFDVQSAPSTTDSFELYINSTLYGVYRISELPLEIQEFPWGGGSNDTVRVCLLTPPSIEPCCVSSAIQVPDCLNPCLIKDLTVQTDSCNADSTFRLTINLILNDSTAVDSFDLYGNGDFLGKFASNQSPLVIDSFLWNGLIYSNIKVCIGDSIFTCCKEVNFLAPSCLPFGPCEVTEVQVETGACEGDSTYRAKVFFNATNPGNGTYIAYANGVLIDTFPLTQIPLVIDSFPWNGDSTGLVQICIGSDTITPGTTLCCRQDTFPVPSCLTDKPCELLNLVVDPGACDPNNDSTYTLVLNFTAKNPGDSTFVVYDGAGEILDTFLLSQLPVTIQNFPWGGSEKDQLKVCITDSLSCCLSVEFNAPDCLPFPCEITTLKVDGDSCTSDSTFRVVINFEVQHQPDSTFVVSVGNATFGPYNLNQLPLTINNFPSGDGSEVEVEVCIANADSTASDCCKTKKVKAPNCGPNNDCSITSLAIETGDCASDSTYKVLFSLQSVNPPSDSVSVSANGNPLGVYAATSFPVSISNFPWGGATKDKITICYVKGGVVTSCCASKEFFPPDCIGSNGPCEITGLVVEPDTCTGDSTYIIVVNFQVNNAPSNQFLLYANGTLFGTYNVNQLPLQISNFPYNGGANDVVKVCFENANCCATKEFPVPNCLNNNNNPCSVGIVSVVTGACTGDSTYTVTVNFQPTNPPGNVFKLYANGVLFGTYELSQLPLTITNFPWNGGNNDVVRVCFANNPDCCESKEFAVPTCLTNNPNCDITNLQVVTGDCSGDSAYVVTINFQVANPPSNTFQLFANGTLFGSYQVNQLPLTITNFPWNGGNNDVVKVCFGQTGTCCETKEFVVPTCLGSQPCEIYDLTVQTDSCTSDSSYIVKINFQVQNAPGNVFQLYANGSLFGTYELNQLPLTITNFPWNGGNNDVVKVCFVNSNCCREKEFAVPNCLTQGAPCAVSNLSVQVGDCTADSTYKVVINFTVNNPPSNEFGVWANNTFLGTFNVSQLPLTIANFPWDGGQNDFVKVCFGAGGVATCCAIKEFPVPACLNASGPCVISALSVVTGDCNANNTYKLTVNFQVSNPLSNSFQVFANGTLFGTFNLSQLPLTINNFPWGGGTNDVIKVCLVANAPNQPGCCAIKDFAPPGCVSANCKIYDLVVIKSPCLCGQFFALLQFKFTNPASTSFDVVVNGNVEATYPYNFPQPIIVGPLAGDNITDYKFAIKDHELGTCADDFVLGKVDCPQSPTFSPTDGGSLIMSPNPATDWLNVSVQLRGGGKPGQSNVDVYHADGRLVLSRVIPDASNFQLEVANLPAGIYRMVLQTEVGRLDGTFAKQ